MSEACDRSCNAANRKYNKRSGSPPRKRRSRRTPQPQHSGNTVPLHRYQSLYSTRSTRKKNNQPKIDYTSRQDDDSNYRIPLLMQATVLQAKDESRSNRSGIHQSGVAVSKHPDQVEGGQPGERTQAKDEKRRAELSRQEANLSQSQSGNGRDRVNAMPSKYLLRARLTITFA